MGDISISNGVRSNLMALQSTARMMEQTSDRLSSGKRVNSALDNPANFFTASAMNSRAGDLSSLLDSMKTGVNTVKAADNALTSITKLVESAQGTARQALQDASGNSAASIVGETGINSETTKAAAEATLLSAVGIEASDALTITVATNGVDTTDSFDFSVTKTFGDLVTEINDKLGAVVTASIGDDGTLSLEAKDGGALTISGTDDDVGGEYTLQSLFGATATINGTAAQAVDADLSQTIAAPTATTNETREKLAAQFNEILLQITDLAEDADFNGINLLKGDDLKVTFNEKTGSKENSLTIKGSDTDSAGLGLAAVTGDFQTDSEINTRIDQVKDALNTLRVKASDFGSKLTTVEARQDFTMMMVDTLEQGASDLTLADVNKEGANMLALQTRQSLATTTMGMASQADQAVLSFLR
jgi:flagellin